MKGKQEGLLLMYHQQIHE